MSKFQIVIEDRHIQDKVLMGPQAALFGEVLEFGLVKMLEQQSMTETSLLVPIAVSLKLASLSVDQDAVDQEQMARLTKAVSRVPRLSAAVIPIAIGPSDFHYSVAVLEVDSKKLFFMDSNCSADHDQLVTMRVLPFLRAALLITDLALVKLPVPRQGRDLNCGPAVLRNSKTVVSAIASKQAIPQVLDYNMGVVLDETRCFLKSNLLQAQLDFSQISAGFSPTPKVPRIQGSSPVASGQMNFFFWCLSSSQWEGQGRCDG